MITRYSLDLIENSVPVTPMTSPAFWAAMQQAVIWDAKREGKLEETVFQNAMELLLRKYGILAQQDHIDR